MFVPILPNISHLTSRAALNPSEDGLSFPWDDCYLSIFNSFEARVRKNYVDEDIIYEVPVEDVGRMKRCFYEDEDRRKALLEEKYPGKPLPPLYPQPPTLNIPLRNILEPLEDQNSHHDAGSDVEMESHAGDLSPSPRSNSMPPEENSHDVGEAAVGYCDFGDDDCGSDVSDSESDYIRFTDMIAAREKDSHHDADANDETTSPTVTLAPPSPRDKSMSSEERGSHDEVHGNSEVGDNDSDDSGSDDESEVESYSESIGDVITAMASVRPVETMPVVTVSFDLSIVDKVNDPQEYFEEVKALFK